MATRPDTRESTITESRPDQRVQRPRMWRVLLHNAEAFTIMMSVHRSGLGVAGVYTHEVAETKLRTTMQTAEAHEFPLLVTMEPEAGPEGAGT
jgi:ATP-dependent Clp protease adaptor protein ClpS